MPIPSNRYVEITSGVGAGTPVPRRELGLRLLSNNELIPTGSVLSFADSDSVADYFGSTSAESQRASFYFSFVSKQITQPQRIDFARWVNADVEPKIFGNTDAKLLATYTAISDGSIVVTIGGVAADLTGIDFSSDPDLATVATTLQTAIRTGTGTVFTAATVTYDAVRGSFNFVGGETGAATITVAEGTAGTDISALIGWRGLGVILSDGAEAETPTDAIRNAAQENNNFGSFASVDSLSQDQVEDLSEWNATQNNLFQYYVAVTQADASAYSTALIGNAGTGIVFTDGSGEFDELLPAAVLAAIDYSRRAASANFMFQASNGLTAKVSTSAVADNLDALRINYVGETQTAGQRRSFFQRGYLTGGSTSPVDMGIYANEQWFKDAAAAALLTLLESSTGVSANARGRAQVVGAVQPIIDEATVNGAISVGRILSNAERATVTSLTGDENAYQQVESIGYWIDSQILSETNNGIQEFVAQYTLIYARDNTIRKVEGSHILA